MCPPLTRATTAYGIAQGMVLAMEVRDLRKQAGYPRLRTVGGGKGCQTRLKVMLVPDFSTRGWCVEKKHQCLLIGSRPSVASVKTTHQPIPLAIPCSRSAAPKRIIATVLADSCRQY